MDGYLPADHGITHSCRPGEVKPTGSIPQVPWRKVRTTITAAMKPRSARKAAVAAMGV